MTAEVAIAAPLLMFILLAITQFALWSFATQVAQSAASQGLAAARVQTGTAEAGEAEAVKVIGDVGQGPIRDVTATAVRTDERARIDVRGTAAPVIPFLRLTVHAEAAGAVERFVPDEAAP
jgi:hypothetical protein